MSIFHGICLCNEEDRKYPNVAKSTRTFFFFIDEKKHLPAYQIPDIIKVFNKMFKFFLFVFRRAVCMHSDHVQGLPSLIHSTMSQINVSPTAKRERGEANKPFGA